MLYVRPHLDYGDIIYHDQVKELMNSLESVQYQTGLIVTGCWKGLNRSKVYRPVSKKMTGDLLLDRTNCVRDQVFLRDKCFHLSVDR